MIHCEEVLRWNKIVHVFWSYMICVPVMSIWLIGQCDMSVCSMMTHFNLHSQLSNGMNKIKAECVNNGH